MRRGLGALELPFRIIFSVLLVAIIGAVAFEQINGMESDVAMQRVYAAADLGLTLSSLLSTSGMASTVYDTIHVQDFDYTFTQGKVYVDASLTPRVEGSYAGDVSRVFADNALQERRVDETLTLQKPQRIYLTTSAKRIIVDTSPAKGLLNYHLCGESTLPAISRIILDSTSEAVNAFKAKYPSTKASVTTLSPQAQPDHEAMYLRIEQRASPAVYVDVDDEDYTSSYALACHIANALVQEDIAVPIIPINQYTKRNSALHQARVGVIVGVPKPDARAAERIAEGAAAWA